MFDYDYHLCKLLCNCCGWYCLMIGIGVITTSWTYNTREFDIPHWGFAWASGTLYFCFGTAACYWCFHTSNQIAIEEACIVHRPIEITII